MRRLCSAHSLCSWKNDVQNFRVAPSWKAKESQTSVADAARVLHLAVGRVGPMCENGWVLARLRNDAVILVLVRVRWDMLEWRLRMRAGLQDKLRPNFQDDISKKWNVEVWSVTFLDQKITRLAFHSRQKKNEDKQIWCVKSLSIFIVFLFVQVCEVDVLPTCRPLALSWCRHFSKSRLFGVMWEVRFCMLRGPTFTLV